MTITNAKEHPKRSDKTHLPIRKDGALVSIENIPDDWLQGCLEYILLGRKACKNVVELVFGLDLLRSASLNDRDGFVGGAGANNGQSPVFLFAIVQWANSYHHLNRSRRRWRERWSRGSFRRRRRRRGIRKGRLKRGSYHRCSVEL